MLVVAELNAGIREGNERHALRRLLSLFEITDAVLAAQTERLGAEPVTPNAKHFPMLAAVRVP